MNTMTPGTELTELIERFARNEEAYQSGSYNETQVRREFIDPFFTLLGWDVANKQGYAEAYKDVVHEDAIKVGGAHKAPDYGFRIGGCRGSRRHPSLSDAPREARYAQGRSGQRPSRSIGMWARCEEGMTW